MGAPRSSGAAVTASEMEYTGLRGRMDERNQAAFVALLMHSLMNEMEPPIQAEMGRNLCWYEPWASLRVDPWPQQPSSPETQQPPVKERCHPCRRQSRRTRRVGFHQMAAPTGQSRDHPVPKNCGL